MEGYPSGTVTFLFTDIEGSTRLWEAQPEAMRIALADHDAILRGAVESNAGTVFKTVGDAFCAAFFRPQDALAASIEAQRQLSEHAWPAAIARICVRMGLHTGTAVETGGDYFGPTVNRVARLMSIGYGEQILVSSTTASLLRDVLPADVALRDLGAHRLKDLSGSEPAYQVVAEGLRGDFPALRSLDSRPNNLPFQISSFVGREAELGEVRAALGRHRLVTIVGPGGIGKTRLALQAAGEMIDGIPDGAWIVQLSALRDAALIAQATADVLHVREEAQTSLSDTLARALADRELLLIFDSSEHLIPGTAAFVKMLLSRCASLKVLVTSREPLHVTGEHVMRISALRDAAELFRERALEVVPDRRFDEGDAASIEAICTRLEGIPLAVELAAARVATWPLSDLYARLSKRLQVLVSRDPTKEERHRTLRGTIAWSYGLLEPADSLLLRSLAAFDGTFSAAAVASIAGGGEDYDMDVLDALAAKSLVSCRADAAGARYMLFDTVREFLIELLEKSGELTVLRRLHFRFYERFALSMTARVRSGEIAEWLDTIAIEISNLRAALDWGLSEEPTDAAMLLCNLSRYFKIRGNITEGRASFRRFLADPRVGDVARAGLLRRAATFATEQDDYDEGRELSEECRALYERLGDVGGVAEALHNLAVIEQRCGRMEPAAEHYRAVIEKFREAGNDYGECVALTNMAMLAFTLGDLPDAERRIEEAASAAARTENPDLRADVRVLRGELALRQSDLDGAARFYRDALATKRALGNRYDVGDIENSLAMLSLRQGRVGDARAAGRETLRIALELDSHSLAIYGFEAFSEIAAHERSFDEAAGHYWLAQQLRRLHSYHHETARKMDDVERLLRAELGERFETAAACAHEDWRSVAEGLASAT